MSLTKLKVATRGSKLALWQTEYFASLLNVDVEIVVIRTEGDRTQAANVPLEKIGGRGVFSKEVQEAVLSGRADFTVHSAKDMTSQTPEGLILACVPQRGDPRDALVGTSLKDLKPGAVVATGSVRRRAQLAWLRPDLTFSGLRGNVDTRIQKRFEYDAVVMAYAPIQRLKMQTDDMTIDVLSPEVMVPQVAQGALGVECRVEDEATRELLASVEHRASRLAVDAERSFLATLGGACDLPVGAYGQVLDDETIELSALLATLDGHVVLRRKASGKDPISLGKTCAEQLLNEDGGKALLNSDG